MSSDPTIPARRPQPGRPPLRHSASLKRASLIVVLLAAGVLGLAGCNSGGDGDGAMGGYHAHTVAALHAAH